MLSPPTFAQNPILAFVKRGGKAESVHRGSWVVVDTAGNIVDGRGDFKAPVFARSAVKCLQALPLLESGAAQGLGYTEREMALALSSHNGEPQHTETALGILTRLGLGPEDLLCGTSPAGDRDTREEMVRRGEAPCPLHHNCSGKHAGFLALARHLGVGAADYLASDSQSQTLVREAVIGMAELASDELFVAIDGCSAPTFRMPLHKLALGFAKFGTPADLGRSREEVCRTLQAAATNHPELIAGRSKRLCTALLQCGEGRLFPKIGAEGVYAVAHVGHGQALAVKMDDGAYRGLHAVVVALLVKFGWLDGMAASALESYSGKSLRNAAGLEVGSIEVLL